MLVGRLFYGHYTNPSAGASGRMGKLLRCSKVEEEAGSRTGQHASNLRLHHEFRTPGDATPVRFRI